MTRFLTFRRSDLVVLHAYDREAFPGKEFAASLALPTSASEADIAAAEHRLTASMDAFRMEHLSS